MKAGKSVHTKSSSDFCTVGTPKIKNMFYNIKTASTINRLSGTIKWQISKK
jgi:hypothetical protein